jgi:nitric oxide reductase subunit C
VSTRPADVIKNGSYNGKARTPEEYIRESIENPSVYIVPGATFSAGGKSIMPAIYHDMLKPEDIDHLVAYLATLK